VEFQAFNPHANNNYAYAPVVFKTEAQLLKVQKALNDNDIFPRRYFFPSLDTLDYLQPQIPQTHSRDVAKRILCLPIYPGLVKQEQNLITSTLINGM